MCTVILTVTTPSVLPVTSLSWSGEKSQESTAQEWTSVWMHSLVETSHIYKSWRIMALDRISSPSKAISYSWWSNIVPLKSSLLDKLLPTDSQAGQTHNTSLEICDQLVKWDTVLRFWITMYIHEVNTYYREVLINHSKTTALALWKLVWCRCICMNIVSILHTYNVYKVSSSC